MKYLPFDTYILRTQMSVADAKNKLAQNLVERKWFRGGLFSNIDEPFEGIITGDTFNINRVIRYRNSFLPFIFGNFLKTYDGTDIKIKMRPNMAVVVFMSFWMGIVGIVSVIMFFNILFNPEPFSFFFLIPFGMFLFGYLLIMGSYSIESNKAKKLLIDLFHATEIIK